MRILIGQRYAFGSSERQRVQFRLSSAQLFDGTYLVFRLLRSKERNNMAPDRARLKHLWSLALQCAEENPELSRFYVNEVLSTDDGMNGVAKEFWMKYCQHCGVIFKGDNCRVRVQPKRRRQKNKKTGNNEDNSSKHLNKKQALKLPRNLNHVGVFCKNCGRQSFYPGRTRDQATPTKRSRPSSAAKQNLNTTQDTTPLLSKSAKARRRSRTAKLKDILLSDERQKSTATASSPQLKDFLSSLGHSISFS